MCIACEMAEWAEMEAAQAAAKRKRRKGKPADVPLFICEAPVAEARKPAKRPALKPRSRATRVRVSAGRD